MSAPGANNGHHDNAEGDTHDTTGDKPNHAHLLGTDHNHHACYAANAACGFVACLHANDREGTKPPRPPTWRYGLGPRRYFWIIIAFCCVLPSVVRRE